MKKINKKAFSLFELAIVILVIATLVLGAVQGGNLINKAKLAGGRSITHSSIIKDMDGLLIWFETTMPNSFIVNEATNSGTISTWYDISNTKTTKNNATQATTANQPTYVANGINGLPAVNFDGTNDYFLTKNLTTDDYTVFIILQTKYPGLGTSTSEAWAGSSVLSSDVGGIANDAVPIAIAGGYAKTFVGAPGNTITSTVRIDNNVANLVTVTRLKSSGAFSLYVNGTNKVSATGTPGVSLSAAPNLTIGNDSALSKAYQGAVSEIIVFNRALSDQERKDVEQYLGKKWGIKVS